MSKKPGDRYKEVVKYLKSDIAMLNRVTGTEGTNLGVQNEDLGLALNELGMRIYLVNLVLIL